MTPEQKQDYMVQFMTDMTLLTQAADAKKIGQSDEFKRKLEFARKKLLMEALLQSAAKDALTDAAMHKVYEEAVKSMPAEEEVHARHILIRAPQGDEKAGEEAEEEDRGDHRPAERRRRLREGRKGNHRGPFRQGQWRRSRLVHQGADGAGVRGCRVQAEARAKFPPRCTHSSAGT